MTYYFDITDILTHALLHKTVTGIQRGVIRIIDGLAQEGHEIAGIVKHPQTGTFRAVDLSFLANGYDFTAADFVSRFDLQSGKAFWFASKLQKYQRRPFKKLVHTIACHTRWALSPALRAKATAKVPPAGNSCLTDLALKPGDILVTLGAGWNTDYMGLRNLADLANCKTVTFVHDIIPLTHPQFTTFRATKHFETWLRHCARHSDLLVCNSNYSRRTLAEQLEQWQMPRSIAVAQYPHEFVQPGRDTMPEDKYVLCVGTITARKNIHGLLQAWRRLEVDLGEDTPTLVLAGANDGFPIPQGLKVKVIDQPDDVTLERLYRGCMFTVFPSFVEGWGLPIGESLWFGKPVLCANTASLPEVGGKYADYFDHDDPETFYLGILRLIRHPRQLPPSIRDELRYWGDTARDLHLELDRLAGEVWRTKANVISFTTSAAVRCGTIAE
jgi:glycosyltransferase involved in cell wall biosynthesis